MYFEIFEIVWCFDIVSGGCELMEIVVLGFVDLENVDIFDFVFDEFVEVVIYCFLDSFVGFESKVGIDDFCCWY